MNRTDSASLPRFFYEQFISKTTLLIRVISLFVCLYCFFLAKSSLLCVIVCDSFALMRNKEFVVVMWSVLIW